MLLLLTVCLRAAATNRHARHISPEFPAEQCAVWPPAMMRSSLETFSRGPCTLLTPTADYSRSSSSVTALIFSDITYWLDEERISSSVKDSLSDFLLSLLSGDFSLDCI
eukprot:IDg3910t1